MLAETLLHQHLEETCPLIHQSRLAAVMQVATALSKSKNMTLTAIGRYLPGTHDIKHKIKKVDRLEGNKQLHDELHGLYRGLSAYVFKLLGQDTTVPIIVDLCFIKDDRRLQMLSAEVSSKGRSIPLYREVFKEGELKDRAQSFLAHLSDCLPSHRAVVFILDAGFHERWLQSIESKGWYWINRVRGGKLVLLPGEQTWRKVTDIFPEIGARTKSHGEVLLTKRHGHRCRLVTTRKAAKGRVVKTKRGIKTNKLGSGQYAQAAKEPWVLTTNLPEDYKASIIVKYYAKRMQIEESFRDIKSHQFGLSGRYARTSNIYRWSVKMLLAAIAQITYWVIGVIAHSQGMQRLFQANTVKDKKVFSYFTLGRLIIEFDKLHKIDMDFNDHNKVSSVMLQELARDW